MTRRLFWIVSASALLLGCQGSIGKAVPGPCEQDDAPAICGDDCFLDSECGGGFYCNGNGVCTADCTAGGDECGTGFSCDGNGQCVIGPAEDCPRVQVQASVVIPTVQLVIDQSGSMNENFNGITRWNAVRQALGDPDQGAVAGLASRVKFGATLYTSNGGNAGGTCPQLQNVDPSLNNFAAIQALLNNNEPVVDTPTAEAVTAVTGAFPAPVPGEGPRIMVLATDGDPDTCVDPDAHNQASQQLSEQAVQSAFTRGIETVVLSVGNEVTASHLQRLANAGKGADLANGNEPFFVANDPAELVAAFDAIIRGARTCEFQLDAEVIDPTTGVVLLNGQQIELGTDWEIDPNDPTILRLIGGACQQFLNLDDVELVADFDCGSVIVVL